MGDSRTSIPSCLLFLAVAAMAGETSALPSNHMVHGRSHSWKHCKPSEPFFILSWLDALSQS